MKNIFYLICVALQLIVNVCANSAENYGQSHELGDGLNEKNFDQIVNESLAEERRIGAAGDHKLSRKRRYLIFPEGSSFQLVYDEIIGVVDYTNYLILGITVALAWELPSKAPSEILQDIKDRLNDGTLGTTRNDTIQNIKYVDIPKNKTKIYYNRPKKPMQYYTKHPSQPLSINSKKNPLWRRKDSYYFSAKPNPFGNWLKRPQTFVSPASLYRIPYKNVSYPWWHKYSRLSTASHHQQQQQQRLAAALHSLKSQTHVPSGSRSRPKQTEFQRKKINLQHLQTSGNYQSTTSSPRKHRIHPIFGKRSIKDDDSSRQQQATAKQKHRQRRYTGGSGSIAEAELSKLDRIHIRHHRYTRQTFYEKIEKYLDKRGTHGHHCVLRALCETGQKSEEHKPGSFVAELMRAVFTLPEPLEDEQTHYTHRRYDEAHAVSENCTERYHLCPHSVWTSQFVM